MLPLIPAISLVKCKEPNNKKARSNENPNHNLQKRTHQDLSFDNCDFFGS